VRSRWLDIGQVLFCEFIDRDGVEVHKLAKKERGQYPAILTEHAWSDNKGLIMWLSGKFFLRGTVGSPEREDSFILPAWVANHRAGFD